MYTNDNVSVNRKFKDTLFRFIFSDKENALSLYNALNNSDYNNPDDLEITTLDDVIFMKQKNDISFLIGDTLNLYEQQSTYCANMPLRGFLYCADLFRKLFDSDGMLYSSKPIKLPLPRYVVFYNGLDKRFSDEVTKQRLSDSFLLPDETGEYEWTATILNINRGKNETLKECCRKLSDYCFFVETLRQYKQSGYQTKEAAYMAVDYCIKNDVLSEFLSKHRREVLNMSLTEFNEEKYMEMIKRERYEDGFDDGVERTTKLIQSLISDNRQNEICTLKENFESLCKEYNI